MRELFAHHYTIKDLRANQLHELYMAMMLKTLGLSLIGVFVPVYLYQLGYSVDTIALYYFVLFLVRIGTDPIGAWLTGYYGPKHIMILSHIFLVITLAMLLTLETTAWPLTLIAALNAVAAGFFFTSYHIEFSKLQTTKKAGSQISTMYRLGKFASAVGPLVGGVIATVASVQVAIVVALAFIMLSALPLALSPEPVRTKQHVTIRGFPWRKTKWSFISNMGLSFDQMGYIILWPLYVSLFIFTENVYLSVGLITSLGLIVSVITATYFGKAIDRGHSKALLTSGVALQSVAHFLRPVIQTGASVVGLNAVADSFTSAIRMPFTKGLYADASAHEGYRDAYIGLLMTSSNIIRASVFGIMFALLQNNDVQTTMQILFVIAGISVWGALLNRYKALQ